MLTDQDNHFYMAKECSIVHTLSLQNFTLNFFSQGRIVFELLWSFRIAKIQQPDNIHTTLFSSKKHQSTASNYKVDTVAQQTHTHMVPHCLEIFEGMEGVLLLGSYKCNQPNHWEVLSVLN